MTIERPALGIPNRVDGIDVSEFQGTIDFEKVAAAGFRFAIVRASLGANYIDRAAERDMAGFRAAGMHVLVYGAAEPQRGEPRSQARRLIGGMGDIYTRPCIDLELRGELGNAQLVDFAEAFVEELESEGALTPAFYSYPDFEAHMQPELALSLLGRCPLWQAYYGGAQPWTPAWGDLPHVPAPWSSAALWQYSGDTGYRVPGVNGACDRDLFIGSYDDFRAFLGLPPEVAV